MRTQIVKVLDFTPIIHAFKDMLRTLALILAALTWLAVPMQSMALPMDQSSGVILAYHRIGQDHYPQTNLRIEQFDDHLQELLRGRYNIVPLSQLVTAIKNKEILPPRTIAITFEGAYQSAYAHGMQKLMEHNIPFTVLYASDRAEHSSNQYLSWKDLKAIRKYKKVEIGVLPAAYAHLTQTPKQEGIRQINKAKQQYREHFNKEATIFSYPFGEWSNEYREIVSQAGFDIGLGLQSGAAHPQSDFLTLPRFSLTERYGTLERFKMITNALPLPVKDIEPHNPYNTKPVLNIGFSLPKELTSKALSCFISEQPRPEMVTIGQRVEVRPQEPIEGDRVRMNCTMPAKTAHSQDHEEQTRWRWFSILFVNQEAPAPLPPQE